MDNETESKFTELQKCIDNGHSYEMDKDTFDSESVFLNCTVCGYTKKVVITEEQAEKIDKLFDDEGNLEKELLKNEES